MSRKSEFVFIWVVTVYFAFSEEMDVSRWTHFDCLNYNQDNINSRFLLEHKQENQKPQIFIYFMYRNRIRHFMTTELSQFSSWEFSIFKLELKQKFQPLTRICIYSLVSKKVYKIDWEGISCRFIGHSNHFKSNLIINPNTQNMIDIKPWIVINENWPDMTTKIDRKHKILVFAS